MSKDQYSVCVGVDLAEIDPDLRPASQMRVALNEEAIRAYAESFDLLPPVSLIHDPSVGRHWLVDGCHTIHAARELGLAEVKAKIKSGSFLDAFREASRANGAHGVRITNEDKRHRVFQALRGIPPGTMTQASIADLCAVTQQFVAKLISQIGYNSCNPSGDSPKVTGRDGRRQRSKKRPRKEKSEQPPSQPEPESQSTPSEPKASTPQPELTTPFPTNGKHESHPSDGSAEGSGDEEESSFAPARDQPFSRESFSLSASEAEDGADADWDTRWSGIERFILESLNSWPEDARAMFVADLCYLAFRLRGQYCPDLEIRIEHLAD